MKLNRRMTLPDYQKGFTIVELLIATLIFSVILLIITSGVVVFSRAYFRGVNTSGLQDTARTISEDISQSVQFSGNAIVTGPGYVCAGNYVYFYSLGVLYAGGAPVGTSNLGVWQQPAASGCTVAPIFNASTGTELLGKNSRVVKFSVNTVAGVAQAWTVDIKLTYGIDNLFTNPTTAAALCVGQVGDEYCATAELNTVVQQRVQ